MNLAFLTVLLAIVGYYDCRWRKIPNLLSLLAVILGTQAHFFASGGKGIVNSLAGCSIAFLFFFIPYLLGGMGAGDVKLAAGMGSYLGTEKVLPGLLAIALVGGLIALAQIATVLVRRQQNRKHHEPMFTYKNSKGTTANETGRSRVFQTVPYGVAISVGTLITLFTFG